MKILAHMAKEKNIPEVIDAFLNVYKGEHEVDYLITTYDPFTEDVRDETLQMSRFGRVSLAYKMETARKIALKMSYDCMFNVEDDNLIPKDALLKLLAADKDLICGIYRYRPSCKRKMPLMPEKNSLRENFTNDDLDKGVLEAYLIPWGCTIFKRSILETVPFTPNLDGSYNKMCQAASISRWVCMDVKVGHFDTASDGSMVEIKV